MLFWFQTYPKNLPSLIPMAQLQVSHQKVWLHQNSHFFKFLTFFESKTQKKTNNKTYTSIHSSKPNLIKMKKIIASLSSLLMLASILSAAPKKDIVDTAVGAGSFKTLVAAVKAAGLVDTLKGEGPFTVFAPTDEAFGKLSKCTLDSLLKPENKHKLAAILTYHVVPGKVKAKKAAKLDSAKTVNGAEITIKPSGKSLMINNAKVVKADIKTSNGIIHIIDTVLFHQLQLQSNRSKNCQLTGG